MRNFFKPLLLFGLLFYSCSKNPQKKNKKAQALNEIEYKEVSISARVSFESPKDSKSFKISSRMKKDSLFWSSVQYSILGEVARLLVTEDSAKLLTKLPKKEYYPFSVEEFSNEYDINFSPFVIQKLLLGNRIFSGKGVKEKVLKSTDQWQILQKKKDLYITNSVSSETGKITSVQLESKKDTKKVLVNYDDFISVQERLVPHNIKIRLFEDKMDPKNSVKLEIKISKIDFEVESQSYPFRVTSKYKRAR